MIGQARRRPRSAAGRGPTNPLPTASNTMQILPPEPLRPVSATAPVLQPIPSNNNNNNLNNTSFSSSKTNNTTLATNELAIVSQKQESRAFLTDVLNQSRSDSTTPTIDSKRKEITASNVSLLSTATTGPPTANMEEDMNMETKDGTTKVDIEGRIDKVQETQDQMRAELEKYLQDVRSRTGDDGTALVEFPDTFDTDAESETDRESSWRKFISDRVLSHPDEELDRETKKKIEKGFGRIAELDKKLQIAEMKYLESQKQLRKLQAELDTPYDSRWDSPDRYNETKSSASSSSKKMKLKSPTAEEAANAMRGMATMTAEDEARVAAIMAEDDDDDDNVVVNTQENKGEQKHMEKSISTTGIFAPVYTPTEREQIIQIQLLTLNVEPPMRTLVFNEKRNTFMLVKENGSHTNASPLKSTRSTASTASIASTASTFSSASSSPIKTDVIAEMREKRVAWAKEKQIDAALSALRNAPLERTIGTLTSPGSCSSSSAPLSIRAIVQPITRYEIDELLTTCPIYEKWNGLEEEIQKLLLNTTVVTIEKDSARIETLPKEILKEEKKEEKKEKKEKKDREVMAGEKPRVIQIKPKERKEKDRSRQKSSSNSSKRTKEKTKEKTKTKEPKSRKSMFGWSVSSKRKKENTGRKR